MRYIQICIISVGSQSYPAKIPKKLHLGTRNSLSQIHISHFSIISGKLFADLDEFFPVPAYVLRDRPCEVAISFVIYVNFLPTCNIWVSASSRRGKVLVFFQFDQSRKAFSKQYYVMRNSLDFLL